VRHLGALLVLAIGCNRDDVEPATPPLHVAEPLPPVAGVPHAGNIRDVATTDAGDAAISLDELGGIRVWPALDGSREPIAIDVPAPTEIALAAVGGDLLAAVLDQAGSAHLLRVTRNGRVTGRSQATGEIPIVQLVADGDGLLALRADQTIDRIAADGSVREHLASDPGERIAAIAARNGAAVAVLEGGTTLRWIDHGAWGDRVTLPVVALRPESVSLAPGHRMIAGAEASSGSLFVFDLGVKPAVVLGTSMLLGDHERTGFVDDDHLVALTTMRWWRSRAQGDDPWAPTTPPNPAGSVGTSGAAANGRAIAGSGAALALVTEKATRYLGWSDVGLRDVEFVDDHVAISSAPARWLWLDDRLAEHGVLALDTDVAYAQVLDEHRAVIEHQAPLGRSEAVVEVIDTAHPSDKVTLGRFANVERLDYDPTSHVFAIAQPSVLHRWRIDAGVTALRDVKLRPEYSYVRVVSSGGNAAIAAVPITKGMRIEAVREDGSTQVLRSVPGLVLAIDEQGGVYTRSGAKDIVYGGDVVTKLPPIDSLTPSRGGDLIAGYGSTGLVMYDRDGHERWRRPVWNVYGVAFSPGDRELFVRALGGIMVVDTLSGEVRAIACGWRFGITDRAPDAPPAGADSVCEDNEQ
jgi:hypothetical protein